MGWGGGWGVAKKSQARPGPVDDCKYFEEEEEQEEEEEEQEVEEEEQEVEEEEQGYRQPGCQGPGSKG